MSTFSICVESKSLIDSWTFFFYYCEIKLKYFFSHTTSTTIIQFVHIITFVRFRVRFMDFSLSLHCEERQYIMRVYCWYKYTLCVPKKKFIFHYILFSLFSFLILKISIVIYQFLPHSFLIYGCFFSWILDDEILKKRNILKKKIDIYFKKCFK